MQLLLLQQQGKDLSAVRRTGAGRNRGAGAVPDSATGLWRNPAPVAAPFARKSHRRHIRRSELDSATSEEYR
jgi:hypothetical protein